jgi:hypothetical protein
MASDVTSHARRYPGQKAYFERRTAEGPTAEVNRDGE